MNIAGVNQCEEGCKEIVILSNGCCCKILREGKVIYLTFCTAESWMEKTDIVFEDKITSVALLYALTRINNYIC